MALSVWAQASATPALFVLVHSCAIKLRSFAQRFAWALFLGAGPSPVADVIERPFSGTCLSIRTRQIPATAVEALASRCATTSNEREAEPRLTAGRSGGRTQAHGGPSAPVR